MHGIMRLEPQREFGNDLSNLIAVQAPPHDLASTEANQKQVKIEQKVCNIAFLGEIFDYLISNEVSRFFLFVLVLRKLVGYCDFSLLLAFTPVVSLLNFSFKEGATSRT